MPGPFVRSTGFPAYSVSSPGGYFEVKYQQWYTTAKGAKRVPLPYTMKYETLRVKIDPKFSPSISWQQYNYWSASSSSLSGGLSDLAALEAMKRMQSQITTASWGQNIAEWRQSANLIASTLKAMRRPVSTIGSIMRRYGIASWRGLSFEQMFKLMGRGRVYYYKRGHWKIVGFAREVATDINDMLFAWDFGVAPLMDDVRETIEAHFLDEYDDVMLTSSARKKGVINRSNYGLGSPAIVENGSFQAGTRYGCIASVSNPACFKAQSLGLLNVPQIALEVIPLSFVVNWVWPIIDWVGTWSAFAGLTLSQWYRTDYFHLTVSRVESWRAYQGASTIRDFDHVRVTRVTGTGNIPIPPLPKAIDWSKLNTEKLSSIVRLAAQRVLAATK